ncbi:MAG: glycosyltransferase family 4 protein [Huintestinicola sp.]
MRKRIALVNQRYGLEVNGGSELYTRQIAERLTGFYDVDVITTKALDYTTWENHYKADEEVINGVRVLRFPTETCRAKDFDRINGEYLQCVAAGKTDAAKEKIWFEKQGPNCPKAVEYIASHKDDYDAFIFVTYLYYLTVFGLPEVPEKSIFIPTAHDEPFIHFEKYKTLFNMPKGFIYLTNEEKQLVNGIFNNTGIKSDVLGAGVDVPERVSSDRFKEKFGIDNYLIYVGRIDEGKNCPQLFTYFTEYKKRHNNDLKLVLMGKAACSVPESEDIVSLGFVSDEDKFDGIKGAKFLVLPSQFESLSISVLEAMALGIPVLVNGKCPVLKSHCLNSNGGLYYNNYFEFEGCVDYLLEHPREYSQMQASCLKYIEENYRWDVIINRFCNMIDSI